MTEESKLIFKSKPFVLGVCNCGCKLEIPIRSKCGKLQRFLPNHHLKLFITKKGKEHHNYKGKINRRKYFALPVKDRLSADSQGYILEHRLVMEQYLGRYLMPDEVVHHRNHKPKDNRIENLQLMTRPEHNKIHFKKDMSNRKCCVCGSSATIINKTSGYTNWLKGEKEGEFMCMKCYKKKTWKLYRR